MSIRQQQGGKGRGSALQQRGKSFADAEPAGEKGGTCFSGADPGCGKRATAGNRAKPRPEGFPAGPNGSPCSHTPGFSVLGSMAIFCAEQHLLKTPVLTRPLKLLPHLRSLSLSLSLKEKIRKR